MASVEVFTVGHLERAELHAVRHHHRARLVRLHASIVDVPFAGEANLVEQVERPEELRFIRVYFYFEGELAVWAALSPLGVVSGATLGNVQRVVCVRVFGAAEFDGMGRPGQNS